MGRELWQSQPVFRDFLLLFDENIQPYVDWSLRHQLMLNPGDPGYRLDEIAVIQPLLLGLEIALAMLWRSWGIEPEAVIGHSMGEAGAAYLAGALNLQEAAKVICLRSKLLQQISGQGGMAVIGLPMDPVQEIIQKYTDQLSIAVSNSYRSTVIAGDLKALDHVIEKLQAQNVYCRKVKVDVAAHSPQVDPLIQKLESHLLGLQPKPGQIPLYSTVTGQIQNGASLDAHYWAMNLRSPVRFSTATAKLLEDDFTIFIELSPHPILVSAMEDSLYYLQKAALVASSLERNQPEFASLIRSVGKLYAAGYEIDYDQIFPEKASFTPLPLYPWQRKRFWLEIANVRPDWQEDYPTETPLLGRRLPDLADLPGHTIWENRVNKQFRRLVQKQFGDNTQGLSEAVYSSIAMTATEAIYGAKNHTISSMKLIVPLSLAGDEEFDLQLVLSDEGNHQAVFKLYSRAHDGQEWKAHLHAQIDIGQTPAEWLYQLKWVEKHKDRQVQMVTDRSHWLIFADQAGTGKALEARLKEQNHTCTLVVPALNPPFRSPNQIQLDPSKPEAFTHLLEELTSNQSERFAGIIYLWNLDISENLTGDIQMYYAAKTIAFEGIINLVQALIQRKWNHNPQIWMVTRDIQSVQRADPNEKGTQSERQLPAFLLQSLTWGLGRTICLEQPELWGGMIDLAPIVQAEVEGDLLIKEILEPDGEDQIAYRNSKRFVARLAPHFQAESVIRPLEIQPEATYMVTGGLGNIGLSLANWLARQGAHHIVLTSRIGLPRREEWAKVASDSPNGKRIDAIRVIEAASQASIEVARANVADWNDMETLFVELSHSQSPLKGIFHAAGITHYQFLDEINSASIDEVFQPKVNGIQVIHGLTKDLPLDFLVLFSSGASIWGSQGLAHYGAANSYLDAVAHYRSIAGLPTLSINWGWWAGEGMVSDEMAELFRHSGLQEMPGEQAIDVIPYLLTIGSVQQVVASVNWDSFKPLYEAQGQRPLLAEIQVQQQASGLIIEPRQSDFLHQISQITADKRKDFVLHHVREQTAAILGFHPGDPIDIRQGFFKLGMDSMMTMQLRTHLEASLNCSLPPTLAFEYPSIMTLTDFLCNEILPQLILTNTSQASAAEQDGSKENTGLKSESITESQVVEPILETDGDDLLNLLDQELSRIDDLLEGE